MRAFKAVILKAMIATGAVAILPLLVAPAASASFSTVSFSTTSQGTAPLANPDAYQWKAYSSYASEELCSEQGQLLVRINLAMKWTCVPVYSTGLPFVVYLLLIYTEY